jgi:hypothetical protein
MSACTITVPTGGIIMRHLIFAGLALAAPFAFTSPAKASSDSTCTPFWMVRQPNMNGCSSVALLSPGNDTRVNLLMLLNDRHGDVGVSYATFYNEMNRRGDAQPFAYGTFSTTLGRAPAEDEDRPGYSGSRCGSNDKGKADFAAALAAAKGVSANERTQLLEARNALKPECKDQSEMAASIATALNGISSKPGEAFANYLRGAAAFYDGDFGSAVTYFQGLMKSSNSWTKEAATYMLARAELNRAMETAFDDYGDLKETGIDLSALAPAERGLKSYLQAYPNGQYAASARGLMRRVYWLAKDESKLLAEYVSAFRRKNQDGLNMSLANLVDEMDVKLGSDLALSTVNDPHILAMLMLKKMRVSEGADEKPIGRAEIEAQRAKFSGQDDLYNYVLAVHALYVAKDADAALRTLPANASGSGYLAYSQKALRALALDMKKDPGARSAIVATLESAQKPFQRGGMELALAMHDERNGGLEKVFAAGSLVKDPEIREILLRYSAGPRLLRAQAGAKSGDKRERDMALYILLYKQLTRGAYKDFLADQSLIPAGTKPHVADDYSAPAYTNLGIFKWAGTKTDFVCPSLTTLATALAGAPKDAPSLLCLGEFARLNGFDVGADWPDIPQSLDNLPQKDQLGGMPSLFPGKAFSRLEIYKGIIAAPTADANSKAYALYRAVYCYAPGGYNSCGGTDVPQSQRKAWHNQLKKSYPASPWAEKLKYYW